MNKAQLYAIAVQAALSDHTVFGLPQRDNPKPSPREKQLTAADIERIQAAEQKRERKRQKALSSS